MISHSVLIAGVDEAGRGCLAGPVVAGAVILDKEVEGLKDSKKLSPTKRALLAKKIKHCAKAWAIGVAWPKEIDRYNIFQATIFAMLRALKALKTTPDLVYVDGSHALPIDVECKAVIKGDSLIPVISAASIIAKTFRDKLMMVFDRRYPVYGFKRHKGYPTKEHLNALKKYGPSPIHRLSFSPVKSVLIKEKRACLAI